MVVQNIHEVAGMKVLGEDATRCNVKHAADVLLRCTNLSNTMVIDGYKNTFNQFEE